MSSTFSELALLEDNWNNEGSKPINKNTIAKVADIVFKVGRPFEIYPLSDGGIQIEYDENGLYLELEVYDLNKVEMFYSKDNKDIEYKFTDFSTDKIALEVLKVLLGGEF